MLTAMVGSSSTMHFSHVLPFVLLYYASNAIACKLYWGCSCAGKVTGNIDASATQLACTEFFGTFYDPSDYTCKAITYDNRMQNCKWLGKCEERTKIYGVYKDACD
ncbi:hypothetical protein EJ03DRAFT_332816 [Teratosphaeria nubilosa]|uniref:Chitin-binding type-2 domain-containing protein n=1 Tax=Teratosphaeria nubilosa TaxID=161662 RepID=A0A6G1LPK2_9PEZI|nr:hypothetical protein EJ03DRAFT_332816 [Teratosphaeria nubilosa]